MEMEGNVPKLAKGGDGAEYFPSFAEKTNLNLDKSVTVPMPYLLHLLMSWFSTQGPQLPMSP